MYFIIIIYILFIFRKKIKKKDGQKCKHCGVIVHKKECMKSFLSAEAEAQKAAKEAEAKKANIEKTKKKVNKPSEPELSDAQIDSQFELIAVKKKTYAHTH